MYFLTITIIDISAPQDPKVVVKQNIPKMPEAIYVAGNYAYIIVTTNGFYIIDVSDPKNPKELSHYPTIVGAMGDVCVAGDYAYITDMGWGLSVLDVSDPNDPEEVGFYDSPGTCEVDVAGVYAYIANYDGVLSILRYEKGTPPKVSIDPNHKLVITWAHLKK
jgi:hypothetical protein